MATPLNRRTWLRLVAGSATALQLPRWAWSSQTLHHNPFGLGVASGEPTPDGMVLWTRLLPPHALDAEHAWAGTLTVHWELAEDERFARIVRHGATSALPELGHSVHVEVHGLQPGRWYYYRFMHGQAVSTVGRTRTAPQTQDLEAKLRIVQASCQRWEHGFYAAWRQAAQDEPDLVLFLGDYIYEYPSPHDTSGLARTHTLPLPHTLQDYRARYALHKSDPNLQAAHACAPWIVTWDDHEVQNNYAGMQGDMPQAAFLPLRSAAWQAFYENMPLRASALLGSDFHRLQLYRRFAWGRLAQLHVLDTRQYRSLQACRTPGRKAGGSVRPASCPELFDPQRSLLGWEQERWLNDGLRNDATDHHTRWSVLAQQTLFSPRHYPSGVQSTDSWDGYPATRTRLLQALQQHPPRNTVVFGGDIHQNYVCNVVADGPDNATSPKRILASEFCGTSISSRAGTTQGKLDALRQHNPHILLARCDERGYVLNEITPTLWRTTLRAVRNPLDGDSAVYDLARFVVQDRNPGPQPD